MQRYKQVLTLTLLIFTLSLTVLISNSKEDVFSEKENLVLNMETQDGQPETKGVDALETGDEFVNYCPYYVTKAKGSQNGNLIKVRDIICFKCPAGANPICPTVQNVNKTIDIIGPDGTETYTVTLAGNGGGCIACPAGGLVVDQFIN